MNSMIEIAYDFIKNKKRSVPFAKIYDHVCDTLDFSTTKRDNKMAQFYTDLSLDNRFTNVGNNTWIAASRLKYDESHVKIEELLIEDDEEMVDESEEEIEGEKIILPFAHMLKDDYNDE